MKYAMRFAARVFSLVCLPIALLAGNFASAAPVADGRIIFVPWSNQEVISANLFLDETIAEVGDPDSFSHGFAEITGGAIRMSLENGSGGGAFHDLHAVVRDHYTILGSNPGEPVALSVTFHVDGALSKVAVGQGQGQGFGDVIATIGGDLPANPTGLLPQQSPHIQPFGTVGERVLDAAVDPGEPLPFSSDLSTPLVGLNVGDTFTLAYRISLGNANPVTLDLTNTGTVSFDLPAGITLQSQNGFGGTVVPEPATGVLALAVLLCLPWRRDR